MNKTLILILGFHRTGTSVLGNYLNNCGIDYGLSKDLTKNIHNRYGYYENNMILKFNQRCLRSLKLSWYNAYKIKKRKIDEKFYSENEKKLENIFLNEFKNKSLFFIKDPRIVPIFYIYYNTCKKMDINIKVVIPIRNKKSCTKSLSHVQKASINLQNSIKLYNYHYNEIENILNKYMNIKYIKYNYEDLIDNTESITKAICDFLEIKYIKNNDNTIDKKQKRF